MLRVGGDYHCVVFEERRLHRVEEGSRVLECVRLNHDRAINHKAAVVVGVLLDVKLGRIRVHTTGPDARGEVAADGNGACLFIDSERLVFVATEAEVLDDVIVIVDAVGRDKGLERRRDGLVVQVCAAGGLRVDIALLQRGVR